MSDKRSVATDALQTLGTLFEDGKRDAIHLAVEPCIAAENLYAGQHIGIVDGKATTKAPKKLGIVDPFIIGVVPEGSKFWLVVFPRQITSLRHVWEHPDFSEGAQQENASVKASEEWLRDFCASADSPSYETIIGRIKDSNGYLADDYFHFNDIDAHGEIPDKFWDHVEVVTGLKIKHRPTYFSCSC